MTASQATTEAPLTGAPDWVIQLGTGLPDLFYADRSRYQSRPDPGGRISDAVERALLVETDWDQARRRILASLLAAEERYSAASVMMVDFWRRKRLTMHLGGVATALYENDMDAVSRHSEEASLVALDGMPVWSCAAITAIDAAADGDVARVIDLLLGAVTEKCTEQRGEGAAISVSLMATTWLAKVIEASLAEAVVPQPR